MSKFTTDLVNSISPYVPGEQPRDKKYIKLNTNENPYYTCQSAVDKINEQVLKNLNRYSDPESKYLTCAIADYYGVKEENVLVTNGSDEALAFCFFAYCKNGVCFPDITYGFYDVIANLFSCPIEHIDLCDDFTIDEKQYFNKGKTVVIANPNAQTGIGMAEEKLEAIIKNNENNIVIVDGAYSDFSDYNAVILTKKYKNLICVNTFSKSRSLAGARVGFIIADEELINDVKKVKNSFHPYNVNSLSSALATEAIKDKEYFDYAVKNIVNGREKLTKNLTELGFAVLPSSANFVLTRHNKIDGQELYLKLKDKGVLVRHLSDERIKDYVRITVGTEEEIQKLSLILKELLSEI